MPSHRKRPSCDGKKEVIALDKRMGLGRAGKKKYPDLKENGNKYLLDQALKDLESYIDYYQHWDKQRGSPFHEERLHRLLMNKRLLESLRDNTNKNTSNIVRVVVKTVKYSLGQVFETIYSEQREDSLVNSIANLQLCS